MHVLASVRRSAAVAQKRRVTCAIGKVHSADGWGDVAQPSANMSAQQHTTIEEIGEHDSLFSTLLEAHDGDANKLLDSIVDFLQRNDTSNAASRIAPQRQSAQAQPAQQGVKAGFFGASKSASAAKARPSSPRPKN